MLCIFPIFWILFSSTYHSIYGSCNNFMGFIMDGDWNRISGYDINYSGNYFPNLLVQWNDATCQLYQSNGYLLRSLFYDCFSLPDKVGTCKIYAPENHVDVSLVTFYWCSKNIEIQKRQREFSSWNVTDVNEAATEGPEDVKHELPEQRRFVWKWE